MGRKLEMPKYAHTKNKKQQQRIGKVDKSRWEWLCEVGREKIEGERKVRAAHCWSPRGLLPNKSSAIFNPVRGHVRQELKDVLLYYLYLSTSERAAIPHNPHPLKIYSHSLHPVCRRCGLSENRSRNVTPDRHISQDHRLNVFPISSIW